MSGFPALQNDRYLRAALKQPVDTTPIWIMRQAGRYLPEYRATRQKAGDFMALCKNPDLACEVTLQPLERFNLDAAILFSDILTIPDAMGLGLYFAQGEGPKFEKPITHSKQIEALGVVDPCSDLSYVTDAVTTIRHALSGRVPLIGFAGSPWTLATYMVEGGGSKDFAKVKGLMYQDPSSMHALLQVLADSVIAYLNAQIEAGAQAVMVFDSWGGVLSPSSYQTFSLAYLQHIVQGLNKTHEGQRIPITLFTKGAGPQLAVMANTGADVLGVDWTTPIQAAYQYTQGKVALQGNLDPSVLYGSDETIRAEAKTIIRAFPSNTGHVFNLGHGIHQHVNPEKVAILVDAVHEFGAITQG